MEGACNPSWWNQDLETSKAEYNAAKSRVSALKRLGHYRSLAKAQLAVKDLKKQLKYGCRASKREEWRQHASDLNNAHEMASFTRKLTRSRTVAMGLLKRPDGNDAKDSE